MKHHRSIALNLAVFSFLLAGCNPKTALPPTANKGDKPTSQGNVPALTPTATPIPTQTLPIQYAISTVVGNGKAGFSGDGGADNLASLNYPNSVAVDAAGNLFIADVHNNRIRKVDVTGTISTVAGNGKARFSGDGGPATAASLYFPEDVAVDAAGNLFIADVYNNRIRKVTASGMITTVAGNGKPGFSGDGGPATSAALHYPTGVAVDASGNLFIADRNNYRIRRVGSNGKITTVAGNGSRDGNGIARFSGDAGPATNASLYCPENVALDAAGNLFIADTGNHRIRRVGSNGKIKTVAGNGYRDSDGIAGFFGDGGPATSAALQYPTGMAVDASGNLFFADRNNYRIRRVSAKGIISTIAGNGIARFSGDGGPATDTALYCPENLAMDASGNLFIADTGNHRIRKLTRQP